MVLGLALVALISGSVLSTIFVATHHPEIEKSEIEECQIDEFWDEKLRAQFLEKYGP